MLKTLLTYSIFGPVIGGFITAITNPLLLLGLVLVPQIFLMYSYILGIVPALATGIYVAICQKQQKTINMRTYYMSGFVGVGIVLFIIFSSCFQSPFFAFFKCTTSFDTMGVWFYLSMFIASFAAATVLFKQYLTKQTINQPTAGHT